MTDTLTPQTHQDRLVALTSLLDSLGSDLPEIRDWSSHSRHYHYGNEPMVRGALGLVYRLADARSAVAAWAQALGAPVKEQLDESCLTVSVVVSHEGLLVAVEARVYVTGRCEGCGGPKVGDEVYRHFTNTPCGGAA